MKRYFNNIDRISKFRKIAESWIGTPYHHMWHTKGRGADCSYFLAECLYEYGLLKNMIKVDYYPTDYPNGYDFSLIEKQIKSIKLEDNVKIRLKGNSSKLKFGDLLLFSFAQNKIAHHSALYMGDNIMLQASRSGIVETVLDIRWKRYLKKIYRLVL